MSFAEIVVFAVGPALLALWVDVRLGARRPSSLRALAVAGVTAVAVCGLVGSPLAGAIETLTGGHGAVALYAGVATAALAFAMLVGLWLVRAAAATIPR